MTGRPGPGGPSRGQGVGRGHLDGTAPSGGEAFHLLADLGGARVEHIVSSATPDPGDQVQGWDEWVLVLAGEAELDVSGSVLSLGPGDWVLLPAGLVHRVRRTAAGTQWLAVHGPGPGGAGSGPAAGAIPGR